MRSLRASVPLWLCLLLVASLQAQTATEAANAQKAKDILTQSIAALGGEAYLKVFDMKQTGRGYGFYRNEPAGVGISFTRYYQYPDRERYEYFKGAEWVIIRVGDEGYETTFRGSRKEDAKDVAEHNRRRRYALDVVLRQWLADPKTAFFYEGVTLSGPKQVHQVSLLSGDNRNVTLFIDTRTLLPVEKKYQWRDPQTRQIQEESELFDEYRVVQGIQTPFKVTRTKNGEIASQRFLRTVEYNVGVGNAMFNPPVIAEKKK